MRFWLLSLLLVAVGCASNEGGRPRAGGQRLVARGEVHSAVFLDADGKTSGWTRIDHVGAVPADRGSWNDHRYAEMYDDFLILTKPGEKDWGTLIIPTSRLVQIHFTSSQAATD